MMKWTIVLLDVCIHPLNTVSKRKEKKNFKNHDCLCINHLFMNTDILNNLS